MQLNQLARIWKRESRTYEGGLFVASAEGRGRDVLFVHGLAASPQCWEQAPERVPGVRGHFVHLRGFSGQPASRTRIAGNYLKPLADELAGYLRLHASGPVAVLGHSMGGVVSLILARDHPDLVDRLMVVDVPAFFSVLINPFATATAMVGLAEHSRRAYLEPADAEFEEHLRRAAEKLVRHPIAVARVVHWGVTSDRRQTADIMAEVMTTDLRNDTARILCPTDIIYAWDRGAAASRVGLDQVYGSAYSGLVDRRLVRIDDARHYIMFDQPDVFYHEVRDWLARPAAGKTAGRTRA